MGIWGVKIARWHGYLRCKWRRAPEVSKKIVRSKDIAFSRNAKRLGHYIEAQGNNTKDGMAEVGMVRHNREGRPTRSWVYVINRRIVVDSWLKSRRWVEKPDQKGCNFVGWVLKRRRLHYEKWRAGTFMANSPHTFQWPLRPWSSRSEEDAVE